MSENVPRVVLSDLNSLSLNYNCIETVYCIYKHDSLDQILIDLRTNRSDKQ